MNHSIAFVGREREIAHLSELYSSRKCVVLVGPAGVGKTALLRQIRQRFALLFCEQTCSLRRIFDSLEQQLGWKPCRMRVVERKNRLLRSLAHRDEPVVLDHVAFMTPRVARFIANLSESTPVWIACRSVRARDIGRIWEHLYKYVRVEVLPLSRRETQLFIENAALEDLMENEKQAGPLFRLSKGNPRVLEALLLELAVRNYDMKKAVGWRLLDIDCRIREVAADRRFLGNGRG